MNSKYEKMIENLKSLGSVAVAFSGGADSTFLLKAAKEALGNNASCRYGTLMYNSE